MTKDNEYEAYYLHTEPATTQEHMKFCLKMIGSVDDVYNAILVRYFPSHCLNSVYVFENNGIDPLKIVWLGFAHQQFIDYLTVESLFNAMNENKIEQIWAKAFQPTMREALNVQMILP